VFQFLCRFVFINFLSFRPDTENNANFEAVSSKRGNSDAIQCRRHNFEKNLNECKGYNARQCIREFPDEGY